MTDAVETTAVGSDNIQPVTDSAEPVVTTEKSGDTAPSVEIREGKYFVNGQRVYLRDEVNRVGANAQRQAEARILEELNVDSIDAVKSVVKTLQETTPTEEGSGLNVESLRDAVKKREATVEELQGQVRQLKTDLLLKDHMGQLQSAMPGTWSTEQKSAVIDLMRARNMLAVEGDTFAIRNGESYLTTDGETPDYGAAVELVGKTLGLPFGKKGVDIQYGETGVDSGADRKVKPLDDSRIETDAEYRAAYMHIRKYDRMLSRSDISHNMVMKQVEKNRSRFTQK